MNREEFNELLEQQLSKFAGQMLKHVDGRMDDVQAKLDVGLDQLRGEIADVKHEVHGLYDLMDGIAKRLDDDDKERAAIVSQLDRHQGWIGQLTEATGTQLVPEQ